MKNVEAEAAMIDLLVQLLVVAVVLTMLVLFVLALDRGPHLRERVSQTAHRRHWWNRTRDGH
jgi:hypothetical protein